MGAREQTEVLTAPAQPEAKNPFAEAAYGRANGLAPAPGSTGATPSGSAASAFAIFDEGLDDAGAGNGHWESEASGTRSEPRFWQPRFYAAYFDITVSDFLVRLARALVPVKPLLGWSGADEESAGGTSMPDLYGPVWVTTTLVLALSMGSSAAEFLRNVFRKRETAALTRGMTGAQFARLWRAAGILYAYVFVFPIVLTTVQCLFAKRSLRESAVSSHPVLGTIMVYGYAMTPVVVAAFVATLPVYIVQLAAIGVAFLIGAVTIMLNLWRDLSAEHKKLTYSVRAAAAIAHAGVGIALLFTFYIH